MSPKYAFYDMHVSQNILISPLNYKTKTFIKNSRVAFTSLTSESISFALADKEPNNPFTNDHILAIRLFWVEVFSSGKNMRI